MPKLPKRIYKRGNQYYLRIVIDGKDIRRSLGSNLLEAKRMETLLVPRLTAEMKQKKEIGAANARQTVSEFANRWIGEFISQQRNTKGVELALQRLRDHSLPVIGDLQISELRVSDLRVLRGDLERKGLSSGTVRHVLGDVRTVLRYAEDCGLITKSPWSRQVMPSLEEKIPESLSEIQVEQILSGTPDEYLLGVQLALRTGIRWGEIYRLRWEDLKDLPHPHLEIRKTKSKKDRRVPLTAEALSLVSNHRKKSGRILGDWKTRYASTAVREIRRRSGVRFTWHQFRHTFACRWLEQGGSKETLQRILGHSTILVTERYGRMSDAGVFAEVQRLALRHGTNHGTVPPTRGD